MKRTLDILYLWVTLLLVAACQGDEEWSADGGFLVSLGDKQAEVSSRATPAEIGKPLAENFHLNIIKHSTGTGSDITAYNGAYTSNLISASYGTYTLTATYGNNDVLAWDSPYYEGTAEAELTSEAPKASVSIPCTVANSLLSVRFTNPELFEQFYSSYYVKVKVENLSVNITHADADRSAYFQAGSTVTLTFHATLTDNGREVSTVIESDSLPETYAAGTHTILSLTAATPTSGTILTIDKVEIEDVTVSETIPLEWLPKPKVTGFGGSNALNYTETDDAPDNAAIGYTTSSALQDIAFTLSFEDEQYTSYNGSYTLSTLTDDERTALEGIGIELPTIDGSTTSGEIGLDTLIANLQTNAGTTTVNSIKVNVKANNRWSNTNDDGTQGDGEEYTITVVKPEFSVSIQEGNMWSKEFTIDEITVSTGNAETIKSNLVYQYSSDGGSTWTDCNDSQRQAFDEHPSQKSYKVRAVYRGLIVSNNTADATLETPAQLPNSDMEDWQASKLGTYTGIPDFWNKYTYYDFLPYSSGETDIWWTTNNERSRDYSVSRVKVTSSPCVSYSESYKHEGSRSALLYTSGHGGGYASTSAVLYTDGAFAGSLFIGTYSWSGSSETITTGHSFTVRPTTFNFWYLYQPKGTDQFKAYIELKNGDDIIATGTFIPASTSTAGTSFQEASVELEYTQSDKKATSVYVQFLSTTKTSFSSSDFDKNKSITFPVMGSWNAHIGSMLYIDDLSLDFTK
ncbi:MAG: DUF4493 domain-containing protein [Bacteroides sp.]|nr:DUF4493 domain-containing protein [Bacteroides sp.]